MNLYNKNLEQIFFDKSTQKEFNKIKKKYIVYTIVLIASITMLAVLNKVENWWEGFYVLLLVTFLIGVFIINRKFNYEIKDNILYNFKENNFQISSWKEFFPFNWKDILIKSWLGDYIAFVDFEWDSFKIDTNYATYHWEQLLWKNVLYWNNLIRMLYRYLIIVWEKNNWEWKYQWTFITSTNRLLYLANFLMYSIFGFIIWVFIASILTIFIPRFTLDRIFVIWWIIWIIMWIYLSISLTNKTKSINLPENIKSLLRKWRMLKFDWKTVYIVKNLRQPYLTFNIFDNTNSIHKKLKKFLEDINFLINKLENL